MYDELHSSWRFLVDWTGRMARKYGGTVYDKETGKTWDWGQALAREMYGPNWNNDPDFLEESEKDPHEPCNREVVERAKRWEAGDFPEWVDLEKMKMSKNIYIAFLEGKSHKQVVDEGYELEGICEICGDECEDLFEHLCMWHTETDVKEVLKENE